MRQEEYFYTSTENTLRNTGALCVARSSNDKKIIKLRNGTLNRRFNSSRHKPTSTADSIILARSEWKCEENTESEQISHYNAIFK